MYKLVESVKRTYLCASTKEDGAKLVLEKAVEIEGTVRDPMELAKIYTKGSLLGKARTVTLALNNLESMDDADQASPLIDLMAQYLPLAQQQAMVQATLRELEKLLGEASAAAKPAANQSQLR